MKHTFLFLSAVVMLISSCKKDVSSEPLVSDVVSSDAWVPTLVDYQVSPSVTDPAISDNNQKHYTSVKAGVDTMFTLVVFLPGTYRSPIEYKAIIQKASNMGYHVIGLSYPNLVAGNPICKNTGDITCHRRLRSEIVDGIDRHPSVSVNPANSILNRLQKVLIQLTATYPKNGWGKYYNSSTGAFYWNKIILAGHSQGAQISGVMGKTYPAKRILMWSGMDFLTEAGKIPDWVNNKTNSAAYYSLISTKDEQIPYTYAKIGWTALGMFQYGGEKNAKVDAPNYGGSHIINSYHVPWGVTGIDPYHNFTALDSYAYIVSGANVMLPAWEYMLRK